MSKTDNDQHTPDHQHSEDDKPRTLGAMYLRFAAMILTAMVVMYWVMFVGSWEWSHIRFSQSRVFMAVTMGGAMVLVMIAWMLNMYKNTKANIAIVGVEYVNPTQDHRGNLSGTHLPDERDCRERTDPLVEMLG